MKKFFITGELRQKGAIGAFQKFGISVEASTEERARALVHQHLDEQGYDHSHIHYVKKYVGIPALREKVGLAIIDDFNYPEEE